MTKKSVYMLDPDNFLSKVSIVGVPSPTCKNSTIWVEILILRIQNYATGLPKRQIKELAKDIWLPGSCELTPSVG